MTIDDLDGLVGVVAGVNVKLAKCGGVGPAARMLARARELGFRTFLGCMEETSVGIAASAAVASLADWVDLDGNLLLADDPFEGLELGDGLPLAADRLARARADSPALLTAPVAPPARRRFERPFRVDNLVDEIVDKPPSFRGPAVLALTASTSERFPGGTKPIVEHPNGDVPASGRSRRVRRCPVRHARDDWRVGYRWIERIAAEPGFAPRPTRVSQRPSTSFASATDDGSVGWPELYDEMCAVAGRGLYRGYSAEDLSRHRRRADTVRDAGAGRDRRTGSSPRTRSVGAGAPSRSGRPTPSGPRRRSRRPRPRTRS